MTSREAVIREFVSMCFKLIAVVVECRKMALRMKDSTGNYPFYTYTGFDKEFIQKENSILYKDRWGNKEYACICGQVLNGPDKRLKKYFSEYGTFWRNSLDSDIFKKKDIIPKFRTTCINKGLASSALIPIQANDNDGLFHISDCKPGRFDEEKIEKLEKVARYLGAFIAKLDHMKLEKSEKDYNVVIVDEYAINAVMIREMLDNWGYSCIALGDPHQAYDYIIQNKTDVLVTEIVLPGMDGLSMIEKIKKKLGPYTPETIVLTGSPRRISSEDIDRLNIRKVLEKPLDDITDMHTAIQTVMK